MVDGYIVQELKRDLRTPWARQQMQAKPYRLKREAQVGFGRCVLNGPDSDVHSPFPDYGQGQTTAQPMISPLGNGIQLGVEDPQADAA